MWRGVSLSLLVVAGVLLSGQVHHQPAGCYNDRINAKGTDGADVTVDTTVGGIVVWEEELNRCGVTLRNRGTAIIRCAPSTGPYALTVSATVGWPVDAGDVQGFGHDVKRQWKCIAVSGSTTVAIIEGMP